MRSSGIIRHELKELEKIITAVKCRDNSEKKLSLTEEENRYSQLMDELKQAFQTEQKHFIYYIVSNAENYKSISIEKISNSLKAFQQVINQICRIIYKENPAHVKLGLITTFPSSFGLMLATENKSGELISRTFFTLDYLFDILNKLNNEETTYKTLKDELSNKKILKSFLNFYKIQSEENIDLTIRWGDPNSEMSLIEIKKERSRFIYNSMKKYAEIPDEHIELAGIVKGISLVKNKIEYLTDKYGLINISAEQEQIQYLERYFNKEITLKLILSSKSNELIDAVQKSWSLLEVISR